MNRKIFAIIAIAFCLGLHTNANAQKKSEVFKTVVESFNTALESYENQFFTDFFELQKTGKEILSDSIIVSDLEQKIFEAFLIVFNDFKTFSLENKGSKTFKYTPKKVKGYTEEQEEFTKQIELIITDYKANRLTWLKGDLSKKQVKTEMMKYINPVVQKFKKRVKNIQDKVKTL